MRRLTWLFPRRLGCGVGLLLALALLGCAKKPAASEGTWEVRTLDGRTLSPASLAGQVVVLDYWATWCAPCLTEIPGYIALQEKYRGQGVLFLGVSLDELTPEKLGHAVERLKINYPVAFASESLLATLGTPEVIPTTVILGRDGAVKFRKEGAQPTATFEEILRKHL